MELEMSELEMRKMREIEMLKPPELPEDYSPGDAVQYALRLCETHGISVEHLISCCFMTLLAGCDASVVERAELALWGARIVLLMRSNPA